MYTNTVNPELVKEGEYRMVHLLSMIHKEMINPNINQKLSKYHISQLANQLLIAPAKLLPKC